MVAIYFIEGRSLPKFIATAGGYSYALYLSHLYIVQFFDKIVNWFSAGWGYQMLAIVLSLVLTNLFAYLAYRFIEAPTTKALRERFIKS